MPKIYMYYPVFNLFVKFCLDLICRLFVEGLILGEGSYFHVYDINVDCICVIHLQSVTLFPYLNVIDKRPFFVDVQQRQSFRGDAGRRPLRHQGCMEQFARRLLPHTS